MAIYTRFGSEITICDARLIPVWVETRPGEIKWHYAKPDKVRKNATVEERPIWHYRGWFADNGEPLHGNKWVEASGLKADDGWPEIKRKLDELCPDGAEKFEAWNKAGAPAASHFFPPVAAREVA
jgi:hypothetical protein